MASVKVTSIEQVSQMAAVVALATEQGDEISQNSQVKIVHLIVKTVSQSVNQSVIQSLVS